ncbi:MAG: hypothetical protein LUD72_06750, partial [Bacteroidales bacterium]|nr:hypothetical protein [Bacteroidales bacterium]
QLYPVVETLLPSYLEGDDVMAVIVKALVLGAEADVYVDDYGNTYPVYYYVAEKIDTGETDEDGEPVYTEVYAYYYIAGDGAGYVLGTDKNGNFVATGETYDYGAEPVCTGDYYAYEAEEGYEYVIINPVVLGDFYDSENLSESIYRISLGDIMTDEDNIITELFGDYTIGDLVDGSFDLDSFPIAAFVDMAPGTDDTLISLLYGVNEIAQKGDVWTCIYTDDDRNPHECVIELDSNGYIDRIYYVETDENGDPAYDEWGDVIEIEVEGVTLGNVTSLVDNLELVTVMGYPDADDALMIYILFGVTDVYLDGDGNYHGTYVVNGAEQEVTLSVSESDDGTKIMSSSYDDEEGKRQSTATTLNDVGDVVGGVTDALSVADFLSDVDPEDALFLYICYSVYDVTGPFTGDDEKVYYKGYLRIDGEETEVK